MYIYQASHILNNIEVERIEVLSETPKQYRTARGRFNKSSMGTHDSLGNGYGLTPDEAVQEVYKYINYKIEEAKKSVKSWSEKLNSEVNYLYENSKDSGKEV